jgi:hypothetical protein
MRSARIRAQSAQQPNAVESRHHHIAQNQIGRVLERGV